MMTTTMMITVDFKPLPGLRCQWCTSIVIHKGRLHYGKVMVVVVGDILCQSSHCVVNEIN